MGQKKCSEWAAKKESVVPLFLWFSKKKMHLHSTVQPLENSKDRWVRNIKLILVDDPGAQREKGLEHKG